MKFVLLIASIILLSRQSFGQQKFSIRGIAVEKTGTPIPYCSVSIKGTKTSVLTNNCGEFDLHFDQDEFTIVFNCISTHDFETFEKRIVSRNFDKRKPVLFKLKQHREIQNRECNKGINRMLKRIIIN